MTLTADIEKRLEAVKDGDVLQRLARIREAREALIFPDEVRRKFLAMAGRIERLFKAVGLDDRVTPLLADREAIKLVAQSIRANIPPADISGVMQQVEALLDESIDTQGYVIREDTPFPVHDVATRRVDLSKIDFDALRAYFDQSKSKRATMDQLQKAAKSKVDELTQKNPTRADLFEKLERLIEEYNAGSHNIQESFEQIREFIESLNEEEQRHVKEGLSEEELAIFDLLTKPNLELTKKDRQLVKKLSKDLLTKLKSDALVIDWRKNAKPRPASAAASKTSSTPSPPTPTQTSSTSRSAPRCSSTCTRATGAMAGASTRWREKGGSSTCPRRPRKRERAEGRSGRRSRRLANHSRSGRSTHCSASRRSLMPSTM